MSISGEELEAARLQGAAVLGTLKRYRRISDAELAQRLGVSRQTIQTYVVGKTRLEIGLMAGFANALDVAPEVFFMGPNEALMWTITNRPNPPENPSAAGSICTVPLLHLRRSLAIPTLKLWRPGADKAA